MAGEIIDACCMINLYAAAEIVSFLSAFEGSFYVPSIVVEESLYVMQPDKDDPQKAVSEQVDLATAFEAGVLQRCDLESDEENELFVRFASEVDDGEAVCLTIAKSRGWSVATDDRKAQRLARESAVSVVTTPELVKRWADASGASDKQVSAVLRLVRDCARFIPRRGAVLHDWWMVRLQAAEE
jgi:predicted nucleic acid-binding protein